MKDQRHGLYLGGLSAVLATDGRFAISTPQEALPLASQISRNLFQYFGADSEIDGILEKLVQPGRGNRIVLCLGTATTVFPVSDRPDPISVDKDKGLVIQIGQGQSAVYNFEGGLGVIFLRPNQAGHLDLVVWGVDLAGLHNAARLVPILTGVGQPDFVVVNKDCTWKGASGIHALGFFDIFWNISDEYLVL